MRSLTVTLLCVVALLGYTTIVLAAEQSLDDLFDQVFTTTPPSKELPPATPAPPLPPPVPPIGQKGGPCEGEAVCIQKHLCTNVSTSGVGVIDIRFKKDNPCVDYLLQCCNPEDIIEDPDDNDGDNDDGTTTTVPSVSTTLSPVVRSTGCGMRNPNGIGFRITGDENNETEYGEFPWMTAILKTELVLGMLNRSVYQCGGSLIHSQVVLTAAHCLNKLRASELKVRAGDWDTKTKNEMYPYQDRPVVEIVIHPDYYKGGLHNDVALLFLDSPFRLNKIIQPVCLPPQDANFDYQTCFATGWGKDLYGKAGVYQTILKKIDLPIMPNEQCQTALRTTELGPEFTLHQSFICAGGVPGKAACQGDGGSPLVCPIPNRQDQYYQPGVVVWGVGCGENGIPGFYANVAKFRNWIDQHMIQRNFGTSSYTA
ncbi:phenoloxidase-activating factor 2-like isoform X2 [Anopheles aquasalis]|uniref:phenoloxidase-activating factor 2-like isoform X2 n=1 Tax=Anopheles aquasalis TaxID=42839 RepID=UPI00215AEB75|nr:phenoloxidase-activating factor 2-like isoform X2 [Anopheles aquasalis]